SESVGIAQETLRRRAKSFSRKRKLSPRRNRRSRICRRRRRWGAPRRKRWAGCTTSFLSSSRQLRKRRKNSRCEAGPT
ncbi:unnamed protein product, partial [Ectocarpus sp. 12 AP-2014]